MILQDISAKAKLCKHSISFRDSYLLLTTSLSDLGKTFDVGEKDNFPYKFVNEPNVDWEFKGKCPEYSYFDNEKVEIPDYLKYMLNFTDKEWDLKDETIKYCENDVKVLYDVIEKFSYFVFSNWNVDIMRTATVSSLAFTIYRSKF